MLCYTCPCAWSAGVSADISGHDGYLAGTCSESWCSTASLPSSAGLSVRSPAADALPAVVSFQPSFPPPVPAANTLHTETNGDNKNSSIKTVSGSKAVCPLNFYDRYVISSLSFSALIT